MRTKTPWTYKGKPFTEAPTDYIGFLYLITCTHPDVQKKYIGRKFFWFKFNTKTLKSQSDWRTYKGSSKNVLADIEKYGVEHFTFEITQLFKTKGGIVSGEIESLWAARVLHATKEDGTRLYYNDSIGNIKFIAKEHLSEEHRQKIAAATVKAWTPARKEEHTKRLREVTNPARKGKASPNQAYTDEQVVQVYRLLEEGNDRRTTAELSGVRLSTVHEIARQEYPRYEKLYNQFKQAKA